MKFLRNIADIADLPPALLNKIRQGSYVEAASRCPGADHSGAASSAFVDPLGDYRALPAWRIYIFKVASTVKITVA